MELISYRSQTRLNCMLRYRLYRYVCQCGNNDIELILPKNGNNRSRQLDVQWKRKLHRTSSHVFFNQHSGIKNSKFSTGASPLSHTLPMCVATFTKFTKQLLIVIKHFHMEAYPIIHYLFMFLSRIASTLQFTEIDTFQFINMEPSVVKAQEIESVSSSYSTCQGRGSNMRIKMNLEYRQRPWLEEKKWKFTEIVSNNEMDEWKKRTTTSGSIESNIMDGVDKLTGHVRL